MSDFNDNNYFNNENGENTSAEQNTFQNAFQNGSRENHPMQNENTSADVSGTPEQKTEKPSENFSQTESSTQGNMNSDPNGHSVNSTPVFNTENTSAQYNSTPFGANNTSPEQPKDNTSTYSYTRDNIPGGNRPYNPANGFNGIQNQNPGYNGSSNTGYTGNTGSYSSNGNGTNPYNNTYTHNNGNNASGSYNNGYNPQGGYYSGGFNNGQPNAGQPNREPPRPPKQNKPAKQVILTKGTAIILCVSCVLLSLAAGILGATFVGGSRKTASVLKDGDTENGAVASDENGDVVLYRSVKTEVETTDDEQATDVTAISELVSDSVVEITTEFVTNSNSFFGQYISEGAGSGVIISTDGYIVTNNHVITNTDTGSYADSITVRLHNGTDYQARVIGSDSDADIAVIKITSEDELSAAVWGDSDAITVGQQIVVVGNPLGELGGTVTTGIISALDREVEISGVKMNLLQTDAAVNPGNSGGGMFNYKGELIGIVNAKSSGTGIEGLGFAIPADDACDVVEQLIENGYVKGKAYLGLTFYEANSGYYSMTGDSSVLYVYSTEEGYNDDVLKRGDIVLTIDGKEVSTTADVKAILKQHKSGDELTFSIIRNKTSMEVKVKCYEYTPSEKNSVAFDN